MAITNRLTDGLGFFNAMSDPIMPKDKNNDNDKDIIQQTTDELNEAVRQTAVAAKLGKQDNIDAAQIVQNCYNKITGTIKKEHNEEEEVRRTFNM